MLRQQNFHFTLQNPVLFDFLANSFNPYYTQTIKRRKLLAIAFRCAQIQVQKINKY